MKTCLSKQSDQYNTYHVEAGNVLYVMIWARRTDSLANLSNCRKTVNVEIKSLFSARAHLVGDCERLIFYGKESNGDITYIIRACN